MNHDTKAIRALLLVLIAIGCGFEFASRVLVPRFFPNDRRIRKEFKSFTRLRPVDEEGRKTVAFLGNSLTLTNIEVPLMSELLGPAYKVNRWSVDSTSYVDWLLGLRKVVQSGGRPSVVVIGGGTRHFAARTMKETVSANLMISTRDLPLAISETHSDANSGSDLVFCHFSKHYSNRTQMYKRLMGLVVPRFQVLARRLAGDDDIKTTEVDVDWLAARLQRLKETCKEGGADLVLWIPPTPRADPGAASLLKAAGKASVPILQPFADNQADRSLFKDPQHLNPAGAQICTRSLAKELSELWSGGTGTAPEQSSSPGVKPAAEGGSTPTRFLPRQFNTIPVRP